MRFLVDECAGPSVARWLSGLGHDVLSIYDVDRGAKDVPLLQKAYDEDRIVITTDKDFGEYVFRDLRPHKGVILLRLEDERAPSKIAALERLFVIHSENLFGKFIVVTESSIRISNPPTKNGAL